MLSCHIRPTVQNIIFANFLRDHCDVAFNPTSIFDHFKVSPIVQWETIWDINVGC
jgi:hypothetical protein